jgi:flavin-dependent dehydrogenase
MKSETCEVVIVGGGPAGCAAACVLAEQGHKVVVLERESFPRYHIGESMIPFTYPPLERIGFIPKLKQSHFTRKFSVQFVAPSGKASQPFYFFNRYDRETVAQSWQVLRSEFDLMLKEHAESRGADFRERHEVVALLKDGERYVGARVRNAAGEEFELRAPLTIDATGRDALAATTNVWRRGDPKLNKIAVWTYYRGSKRDEGIDEGQTTVAFISNKGWFWHIPQHNDMVSVGVVSDGKYLTRDGVKDPKAILEREIPNNQWIADRLASGTSTGEYWITNEYTFRSEHSAADGLVLVGDAYGFLDPVFSSGLMLALKSGVAAADAVHEALVAKDYGAHRFAGYSAVMREGIENMRKLVYAFYDPTVSFRMVTDKSPELAGDLTDCLSGDVNKDFTGLFAAFSEFTPVPEPLPYGMPKTAGSRALLVAAGPAPTDRR